MTAPSPAQVVARCMEHVRCRAARAHIKPTRRMQIIGRLDPAVFLDQPDDWRDTLGEAAPRRNDGRGK